MARLRCGFVVWTGVGVAVAASAAWAASPFSFRVLDTAPVAVATELQGGTEMRYELALVNVGDPALVFASLCNAFSGACLPVNGCNNVVRMSGQGCSTFGTVGALSTTGPLYARALLVTLPSGRADGRLSLKVTVPELAGEYGLLTNSGPQPSHYKFPGNAGPRLLHSAPLGTGVDLGVGGQFYRGTFVNLSSKYQGVYLEFCDLQGNCKPGLSGLCQGVTLGPGKGCSVRFFDSNNPFLGFRYLRVSYESSTGPPGPATASLAVSLFDSDLAAPLFAGSAEAH